MIWTISWKNIWRNKLRSSVVIVAVAIGIFGGVFTIGLSEGMVQQRIEAAIYKEISHVQLHHAQFSDNYEAQYAIENADSIIATIEAIPEVKAVCRRTKISAMAANGANANGVMLIGINPEKEKQVTRIFQTLKPSTGTYFEHIQTNPVLISEKLAKELKIAYWMVDDSVINDLKVKKISEQLVVKIMVLKDQQFRSEKEFEKALTEATQQKISARLDWYIKKTALRFNLKKKVILTMQDVDGNMVGAPFKITGIYRTSNSMFDEMNVFVRNDDLISLTGFSPDKAHEIAVIVNDTKVSLTTAQKLKKAHPSLQTVAWLEIQPDLAMMTDWMELMYFILIGFILFALGFGIVNTMLMVVLERVKELGMLMAIGMNKRRIFLMIMLETVFLCLIGGVIGMAISLVVIQYYSVNGLDFTHLFGDGLEALGYEAFIYTKISFNLFTKTAVMIVLTGILASIYPARKALKLNPSEAIRTDN